MMDRIEGSVNSVKERVTYVDYMKAMGIFIVVMGHQPITNTYVHDWIFSFHMALFFFISGFLVKACTDNRAFLKKNVFQLLLVIFPYYFLGMAFSAVTDYFFYPADFNVQHDLTGKLRRLLLGESTMGAMWFLVALFWMRVTYNVGLQVIRRHARAVMLGGSVVVACVVYAVGFRFNCWQITAFLIGFPFYCCGAMFRQADVPGKIMLRKYSLVYAVFLFALSVFFLQYAGSINLNDLDVGSGLVTYYIAGMLGILFLMALSQRLPKSRIVETVSNGTLVILGVHQMLIQVFKLAYKKLFDINASPPYMDTLSALLISLLIVALLYYPIVRILRSGKRGVRFLAGKK